MHVEGTSVSENKYVAYVTLDYLLNREKIDVEDLRVYATHQPWLFTPPEDQTSLSYQATMEVKRIVGVGHPLLQPLVVGSDVGSANEDVKAFQKQFDDEVDMRVCVVRSPLF